MTTSSCWVRGYNSTPSPTVQSTPVNRTAERDSVISLHQPHSGKKHSSSRTNDLARITHPFECWNGDVATRVDCVPQRLKFFKKYLFEGMSDPGKIIRPGR